LFTTGFCMIFILLYLRSNYRNELSVLNFNLIISFLGTIYHLTMRKLFLFLLVSGISFAIYGQELGYFKNDSAYISCDIYPQSEVKSAKTCMARLKNTSQVITYTPDQIQAYGYGKTDYYSLKIVLGNDTIRRFLDAIVQGDSPVYYLADESGNHFYILNDKKEPVELIEKKGEYKQQLAVYYEAPVEIIPRIHYGFTRSGLIQTVKLLKGSSLETVNDGSETKGTEQKVFTIKQKKRLRIIRPVLSLTFQSGITSQHMPLDLQVGLPSDWNELKASSITYSMSADMPLMKYRPVTYHQEVCFNKFVNDYRQGSDPPEYQLIQDFSVISLPAMVRYTFDRKKFTGFVNAGVQVDIAINKNNIGWLILSGNASSGYGAATIKYMSYSTIQPGITAGFGLGYKLSKKVFLNSEFRFSSVFNVLPDKPGTESQSAFKVGVTYNIFKKEK